MAILDKIGKKWEEKILEQILKRENLLEKRREELDRREEELKRKEAEISGLTAEQAKKLILDKWEEKLQEEIAKRIKAAQEKAQQEAKNKAREILVEAMQHAATNYVAEYTVSTVKVTDEEMKGRIIGKEGRNIRTFERKTGVDVDLDEEGIIRLSSFDPVRRELARTALERLMADGRIQPVRIEEIVKQTKENIEKIIFEAGEELCHKVGIYNLPKDKIALLGRFKYRFSYGQNMIAHTLEETKLGVKLAHELGADVSTVRLGCLLHDIGKVITEREGNHVELGVELLKKNKMPQSVIDCVASHHEDTPFSSLEAVIVYIADSISGARPGARVEDYQEYINRLKDLETIVKSFPGVSEVYAVQAGREIRVVINPEELDDNQLIITAQKIKEMLAKKYPNYPGSIKITLIREVRATEVVK